MGNRLENKYPPYTGSQPFLYLCCTPSDLKSVQPLLERMSARGCRVWYCVKDSETVSEEKQVQDRIAKAGLVVAYSSADFDKSTAKSRMMALQSKQIPVIVIDAVKTDNLSGGLREGTVHIPAYDGITDETEAELIRSEGFSQEFLGPRPAPAAPNGAKKLLLATVILTAFALIAFVLTAAGVIHPPRHETPESVHTLELKQLPEDLSELEQYPNLEKIILPQSLASGAEALMDRYTIVIHGEG